VRVDVQREYGDDFVVVQVEERRLMTVVNRSDTLFSSTRLTYDHWRQELLAIRVLSHVIFNN